MNKRRAGFTLIEILVVMVIVGTIAGMVLVQGSAFLNFTDLDGESKRIRVLLNMLRDEAVIQGLEYGFEPEAEGYRFFYFDESQGSWNEMENDPFGPYEMPTGISLLLKVEEKTVSSSKKEKSETSGKDKKQIPPVLIYSSGETTPFELEIREHRTEVSKVLSSDGYTDVSWLER